MTRTLQEILGDDKDISSFLVQAQLDYKFFGDRILGLDVQPYQSFWVDCFDTKRRSCFTAPRGSGKCIAKGSRISMGNGSFKPIENIKEGDTVISFNEETLSKDIKKVQAVYDNGIKPGYLVQTRNGRQVVVTSNHPFLVGHKSGKAEWRTIDDGLCVGTHIAQPRDLHGGGDVHLEPYSIKVLAYMLAEGHCGKGRIYAFSNGSPMIISDMSDALSHLGCVLHKAKGDNVDYRVANKVSKPGVPGKIREFLIRYKLLDSCSHNKRVPTEILNSDSESIRLFLNRFWGCDGWVSKGEVAMCTVSQGLAKDIQLLLLRLGILSKVKQKTVHCGNYQGQAYTVTIEGRSSIVSFLTEVKAYSKETACLVELHRLKNIKSNSNIDIVPKEMVKEYASHYVEMKNKRYGFSRESVVKEGVEWLGTSDVTWDRITNISFVGEVHTYDLTIEDTHNFVAEGIIVHNTYALGVAFPIWKAAFHEDLRFLITAASKDRAKDIVKELRDTIEGNELLNELLTPKGKSTSWSSTGLKTKTNCQINVRAFTAKGIRGQHVDYSLLDEGGEILDHRLYFSSFVPTVTQRSGHIVVIGTPNSELDLLSVLQEEERGYFCRTYSMWDDETQTSLWPGKFPKDELDRLKAEQGIMNFRREYLCQIIDEGVQPFPLNMVVSCYDPEQRFENVGRYYQVAEDKSPSAWGEYYIGVDLALSPQGDYTVYIVIERLGDLLYIRDIHRIRGVEYNEQARLGKQLYDSFKPMGMLVDKSNFGEPFVNELRDMGVPADMFKFSVDNRNLILNNLTRVIGNTFKKDGTPRLVIPRDSNDEICLRETATLTDELQKFIFDKTPAGFRTFRSTGKHDDTVMSLALAVYAATQHSDAKNTSAYVPKRSQSYGRDPYLTMTESFIDPFFSGRFEDPFS